MEGFVEVRCDLLGISNGAKIFVIGRKDASQLVFCQAGYPDNHSAFVPLARRLAEECDCFVAVSCMPEFDLAEGSSLQRPAGYSHDETALCFGQAVAAFRKQATSSPKAPLTLVLHDWGVAPGTIYANRCVKENSRDAPPPVRLVLFDVLPPTKAPTKELTGFLPDSFYEFIVHLNYRAAFAASFLLTKLSGAIATAFFNVACALTFGVFVKWLNPTGALDGKKGEGASVKSTAVLPQLCYPYYYMFREMVFPGALMNEFELPSNLDEMPVLFLFGKEKNTMFHTAKGLSVLDAAQGSNHVGIPAAAHWLYLQKPETVFPLVTGFMKCKEPFKSSSM
mmetsp:Transcript_82909/g.161491  ORF Transcript_82909/g.161491 Transcript_82909/m.161491 type:complete len:337 (+) Transcript_82909:52-1062(+)